MKKICYSDRSRNEAGQYLENKQRKEKPAMAPKVVFLAVLATLPILGFVCRNPFQAPSSGQNTPTSQAPIPTGWREYRNTNLNLSFNIPKDWDILERASEVWLSDTIISVPPPDLLDLPVVISVTTENPQITLSRLQRLQDEPIRDEIVRIENKDIRKLTFSSRPDFQVRVLYIINRESEYIKIGLPANVDNTPELKGILESLTKEASN